MPETQPASVTFTFPTERKRVDFQPLIAVCAIDGDMQDIFSYTNNGLLYNFDSLTSDVRLPVAVPFRMDIENADPLTNTNPDAIATSDWPSDYIHQGQVIEAYNQQALHHLTQAADAAFTPDLAVLDGLVHSLQISAP